MARIEHVIVLALERRSFDHVLGFLDHPDPVFDGLTKGGPFTNPAWHGQGPPVVVSPGAKPVLPVDPEPDDSHDAVMQQLAVRGRGPARHATNQGFVASYEDKGRGLAPPSFGGLFGPIANWVARKAGTGHIEGRGPLVLRCQAPEQVPVLATLALEFGVCSKWFASVPGETWPNRNFLHAATSDGTTDNEVRLYDDPTVFELLEQHGRSWHIYHDDTPQVWAFQQLWSVSERVANWFPLADFAGHVEAGALPSYCFIEPGHHTSDIGDDEQVVAYVYEALRRQPAVFEKSLFMIVYASHGGLYDHVPPPTDVHPPDDPPNPLGRLVSFFLRRKSASFDFTMYGPRVPAVVVSPYVRAGTVSAEFRDHASVPATLRALFAPDAEPLTRRDQHASPFHTLPTLARPRAVAELPDLSAWLPPAPRSPIPGHSPAPASDEHWRPYRALADQVRVTLRNRGVLGATAPDGLGEFARVEWVTGAFATEAQLLRSRGQTGPLTAQDLRALHAWTERIAREPVITETIRRERTSPTAVLSEARARLRSDHPELVARYRALADAEAVRQGRLSAAPGRGTPQGLTSERELSGGVVGRQRAEAQLSAFLRSIVVVPAIVRSSGITLRDAGSDVVEISEAPNLSVRITAENRIQTRAFRKVVVSLGRTGGVALGIAGTRGIGKSELLRAFCEPQAPASIEGGGVIGVYVPAPVAYEAKAFLRLLIRRLCEKVPGYDPRALEPLPTSPARTRQVAVAVSVAAAIAGLVLVREVDVLDPHVGGWILVVAGLVTMGLSVWWPALRRWRDRRASPEVGPDPPGASEGDAERASREATEASRRRRADLAREAAALARRVRYTETQSLQAEGSAGTGGMGLKLTRGTSVNELPLTEADLVGELDRTIDDLRSAGYEVIIGIDELDKLETEDRGEDARGGTSAERFLNDLKVLFAVHGCSFLVTVSVDAWARFARRGLASRDVFDSSLDTVVTVDHLSFTEARSLVRWRTEELSDTQVLLCHCLSGGLPRDFLRYCRLLGEANELLEGRQPLATVLEWLLQEDFRVKVQAWLTVGSHGPTEAAEDLIAEMESLLGAVGSADVGQLLKAFMERDPQFVALCCSEVGTQDENTAAPGEHWIRRLRREAYAYLYFLESVRAAFGTQGPLASDQLHDAQAALDAFEVLTDARRRMEADPAAGWRRIVAARQRLGLSAAAGQVL